MTALVLDHLVVGCARLAEGVAFVEDRLGVALSPGGRHDRMGTHNRLMALGPGEYLEVIAVDPDAPPPGRARWFDLDRFAGAPRLVSWVLRCPDLGPVMAALGPEAGVALPFARGEYAWTMAVPPDGRLGFDGVQPAVIRWDGPHPADALPDSGATLARLTVHHPEAPALGARLGLADPRIVFTAGAPALVAEIETRAGTVALA